MVISGKHCRPHCERMSSFQVCYVQFISQEFLLATISTKNDIRIHLLCKILWEETPLLRYVLLNRHNRKHTEWIFHYISQPTLCYLTQTTTIHLHDLYDFYISVWLSSYCPMNISGPSRETFIACLRGNSPLSVDTMKVLGVVSLPPTPFSKAPYDSLSWSCQFRPNRCIAGERRKKKDEGRENRESERGSGRLIQCAKWKWDWKEEEIWW